jgi:ABC-type antimicrobial peptide transport system permease subunit
MVSWTFDYRMARRRTCEVVGVARDAKTDPLSEGIPPAIYFPLGPARYAQPSVQGVTLLVRAVPGADALAAVRREIAALDDKLSPFNARAMREQLDEVTFLWRVVLGTYGTLGGFGLVLAAVGLAGVTAYSVRQRTREIGIRMALGARSANVLGLVMKQGARLAAVGTVLGLAGAWAGTRALSWIFYAANGRTHPWLLAGVPALLIVLAMAACYLPARRALRIDPAVTLREE